MKSTNTKLAALVVLVLSLAAFVWSYWPTFVELGDEWSKNPLYSHGYLVPVFAAFLLWFRRDKIPAELNPSWLAVILLAVAGAMRLGAAYYYYIWPERGSILVMAFAITLAIGGWPAFRWAWPSIAFLGFMLPFPGFVETHVVLRLQRLATIASTNVLQTLGFFAQADGNLIILSERELGIVEACSGLRMLSTFVALTVGACFVISRPYWQKPIIALSAIPIALFCNVARITVTGILSETVSPESADFFHEHAGWVMMPLALGLLLAELKYLDLIFVPDSNEEPVRAAGYGSSRKQVAHA